MAPRYSKPTATKTSALARSTTVAILSGLLALAPFRQSGTSPRAHPTPKPTSGSLPATSAMPSLMRPCAKDNMLAFDDKGTRLADCLLGYRADEGEMAAVVERVEVVVEGGIWICSHHWPS